MVSPGASDRHNSAACSPAHAAGHGFFDTDFGRVLGVLAVAAAVIGGAVIVVGAVGAALDA